jgi:tRNA(adenine34) deaminase
MSIDVDQKFMQLAIAEAKRAKREGDLPFGAVVICDGEVVGKGRAQDNITQDVAAHAELQAVREACKTLSSKELVNCVIYCTNEPCIMCAAAIFQASIPKVIIGASREDIPHILRSRKLRIDDLAEDSGHKIELIRGVLRNDVLELFEGVKRE